MGEYEFENPFDNSFCIPYYAFGIFYVVGAFVVIFMHTFTIGPLESSQRDRGFKFWFYRIFITSYYWLRIVFTLWSCILIWTTYANWRGNGHKSSWKKYSGWVGALLLFPSLKFNGGLLAINMIGYTDQRDPYVVNDKLMFVGLILNGLMDVVLFFLYFGSSLAIFAPGFYIFAPQPFIVLFGVFAAWMAVTFLVKLLKIIWTLCCIPCRTCICRGKDPTTGDFFEERHVDDTMNMAAMIFILYMSFWVSIVAFQNFINHQDWYKIFRKTMLAEYCDVDDGNWNIDFGDWEVMIIFITWLIF